MVSEVVHLNMLIDDCGQWLHVAKAWEALVNSPLYKDHSEWYSFVCKQAADYL